MATVTLHREGIKDLENQMSEFMHKLAEQVVTEAKNIVPVRTGELRDSIEILNESTDSIDIGSEKDYALYVELGTRYMRAQPYLRPSLDKVVAENK